MSDNLVILNYEGPVKYETTGTLLQQVKDDLETYDIKKTLKKRIYSILVECIENILRHNTAEGESTHQPYIKLVKGTSEYRITTGNLILNKNVDALRERLNTIIHSDKEQLKQMYEKQINQDAILGTRGAGLGLITIALKTDHPIHFEFIAMNEHLSIFELQVIIPIENI